MKSIRVLHCPSSIGGHPQGLARAERRLGLASTAIVFEQHYLNYQTDEVLFHGGEYLLTREYKRWKLIWRALREFDIVHFNFGRSIMPMSFMPSGPVIHTHRFDRGNKVYDTCLRFLEMRDLPMLKWAGKGIFITYQGDDARQGDYCFKHFSISPAHEVDEGYYTAQADARKRHAIRVMERYADKIYALNPDLLYVLPYQAEFLPYASVDLSEWCPVEGRNADVPVVLHAPSHRGVKGTRFILNAVKQLREAGVKFEFKLVENCPQIKAREIYEHADLLVDQLLCGWYGGLAVELMALGKPVMAYIREEDLKFVPAAMRTGLPVISATPHTVYRVLKEWLTTRKQELPELGKRSRAYVEKWHNPATIAERLKRDYESTIYSKQSLGRRDLYMP